MHKTFSGSSLDELNETIEGLRNGDPLLDIEKRYVYDHNGSIYAFGFKPHPNFTGREYGEIQNTFGMQRSL